MNSYHGLETEMRCWYDIKGEAQWKSFVVLEELYTLMVVILYEPLHEVKLHEVTHIHTHVHVKYGGK